MNRKVGVILSYFMMIFEVLSTLLLTPFILRTLGQAEYGVYKLSAALVSYLLLLDLGVGNAVVRYMAKYRAQNDEIQARRFLGVATLYYGGIALLSLLIGMGLIMIFPKAFSKGLSIAEIILAQKLLFITMLNSAVTLATSAYNNVIIAYEKFAFSKGWSIIQIVLRMILTLVVLKMGMGSLGIVTVHFALTVVCRIIFIFYVSFGLHLFPLFKGINIDFIKEVFTYSSFILLQMIATQINAFADQILLGIFVSSSAVIIAVYGIGSQIVQYFQSIGTAVTGVLMPGIVNLVEKKASSKQLCDEMIRIGRTIFMMLSLTWVVFAFYGRQFITLWAGEQNENAFYVALILMFVYIFILTEAIGTQILWAMNAHKEQSISKICIVLLNIVLTIILIRWNPLLGATIGTFISLIVGDIGVMNIVFVKKIGINLKDYYRGLVKGILPSLMITAVGGGIISLFELSGWLGFICNVSMMVLIYIVCMWLFGFSKYEKKLVMSIIDKLKK